MLMHRLALTMMLLEIKTTPRSPRLLGVLQVRAFLNFYPTTAL